MSYAIVEHTLMSNQQYTKRIVAEASKLSDLKDKLIPSTPKIKYTIIHKWNNNHVPVSKEALAKEGIEL